MSMSCLKTFILGHTNNKLPIMAYHFSRQHAVKTSNNPCIFILGGVHGDEVEGVIAAQGLIDILFVKKNIPILYDMTIVPILNFDGFLCQKRVNASGVDLNRNLPTKDWQATALKPKYQPGPAPNSEPENQAMVDYILKLCPEFIISLHSWKPLLNVNGDVKEIAKKIAQQTGYEIVEDIGYPTPGSLGTYGQEKNIPVLTYEIERGLSTQEILRVHVPAIFGAFH